MATATAHSEVKRVGANGQISLGKRYAGRQVLVEQQGPGIWLVRTATVIPDNERWLRHERAAVDLEAALAWSAVHPASDAEVDKTLERLGSGRR